MMGFPNGTLRRLESANKAIADELPVLHSRSAIIGDPDSLLWVICVEGSRGRPSMHFRYSPKS
jgi:hypothetical protein